MEETITAELPIKVQFDKDFNDREGCYVLSLINFPCVAYDKDLAVAKKELLELFYYMLRTNPSYINHK